jgi:dTDP-4-amino-4,6-dideoxygalactose transaminase
MISLFKPYIPPETVPGIKSILKSGKITQGIKVDEFEKAFTEFFRVPYPLSLNSGTSALETAYELIGLKPGDEVITTPLTCAATNIPLLRLGCKIVWADIREDTLCICSNSVRSKLTEKTRAIVQVNLGGVDANVGKYHVPVISDSCQALGIFNGTYTCCSFQAIKHITTGDGGMLICPDEESYKKGKLMRWFGINRERKIREDWESYRERMMSFDIEIAGTKRHMNDLEATMGIIGLKHYNEVFEHRLKLMLLYKKLLADLDGIYVVDGDNNVCWLCTVIVNRRDDFARKLYNAGIECNIVQVRNDIYKIFGGSRADLPVMNALEDKYLSLPLGMHITEEQVEFICSVIKGGW